jgi:serine-threonine kinase receptor-associated protein
LLLSFAPLLRINKPNGDRQHPPVSIPLPHPVSSASLHPVKRDRFVVGSSADPWVRVYDLDTGKEQEVYKGHHGPVHCVSYSPDGEVYGSGSEDGEPRPVVRCSTMNVTLIGLAALRMTGTIRLWQTSPGTTYGLWQSPHGQQQQAGEANGNGTVLTY